MRVIGYCEVCRKIRYVEVNWSKSVPGRGMMVGRCGCDLTPREPRRIAR